jgi:hypothetical protein
MYKVSLYRFDDRNCLIEYKRYDFEHFVSALLFFDQTEARMRMVNSVTTEFKYVLKEKKEKDILFDFVDKTGHLIGSVSYSISIDRSN